MFWNLSQEFVAERFGKTPVAEIIFSKITEESLKKLFITIKFLVICQVSLSQKCLQTLEPI